LALLMILLSNYGRLDSQIFDEQLLSNLTLSENEVILMKDSFQFLRIRGLCCLKLPCKGLKYFSQA
jgi:hypothetical protein